MGKVLKALEHALQNKESTRRDGVLPGDVRQKTSRKGEAVGVSERALFDNLASDDIRIQDWNEKLIAVNEPSSPMAENFRRLRTKILHPPHGSPPKSILITSAAPNEGKSFVCANLGITIAQGVEQHALIVDGDLRRPTIAKLFGLKNDRGLVNFLYDKSILSSLIKKTSLEKLSIIPSGLPPINPSELIASEKMSSLVNEVVSRYPDRFILIDAPPFHAAAETAILAKLVDAVVLVVRWGVAARYAVKETMESLGKDKIVGIVFNAFEKSDFENKISGYYYSHYEKYGYFGKENK